ncbi:MAG: non-canonical purine NTP pyrophosphatase [Paracoccaceae bacterium]
MSDPKRDPRDVAPPLDTEGLGPGPDSGRHGGAPPRAAMQGTKGAVAEPVQAALSPRLAAAGFQGFGPGWRRERDGLLDIVAVEAAEIGAGAVAPRVTLALAAPAADGRAPIGPEGAPAMRRVALDALGEGDAPAVPPGAPLPEAGDDGVTDPDPEARLRETARAAAALAGRLSSHGFDALERWRAREALEEAVRDIEARWRESGTTDAAEADFLAAARARLDATEPSGGRRLAPGRLVIATHNAGKLREIDELLSPYGIETASAADLGLDDPEETGATYAENAVLKARAAAGAAGCPALADDSGLSVNLLRGAPGVRSARWAEDERGVRDFARAMERLRDAVEAAGAGFGGTGDQGGTASRPGGVGAAFHCALALAWPDGHVETVEGRAPGRLIWPPRGEGGFGYDPMFVPAGERETFAEMASERKRRLSHRALAFERLRAACLAEGGEAG